MIVTRLKLANLRAIEAAEFSFQPGFNLIVGVNGVGKKSALDALSVCLSAVVKRVNELRVRVDAFTVDDIRIEAEALTGSARSSASVETWSWLRTNAGAEASPCFSRMLSNTAVLVANSR